MSGKVLGGMALEYGILALAMFPAAGTLDWPVGWAFLILMVGFSLSVGRMSAKQSPGMLEERLKVFQKSQKGWDKAIIALIIPLRIAWLVLTSLDAVRFRWSQVPTSLQALGAVGLLLALSLMYLTFRENSYLSGVARIQEDRGQTVVSTGPYRYVRHPLYAAVLIQFPFSTLLLGSWYGLLAAALLDLTFVIRAALEDRMLRAELGGYGGYAARVRYRVIPYLW